MSDNDIITATDTGNAGEDRLWQRLLDLERRCADLQRLDFLAETVEAIEQHVYGWRDMRV
jgi:hypothetical protein